MTTRVTVAVVATVLNEQPRIGEWLAALDAQTLRPDEIVIVDGGSTDGTWEVLADWAASRGTTVRREAGLGIAAGRNLAISLTSSDLIAVTDAGTRADPTWLARLVEAFDENVDVASGFFRPETTSAWERALAAATLPDVGEIRPERFQPSSRSVAFRRRWWDAGVRYPEWLDYCEDLVWDFALRRAGARFRFVQDASVTFAVRPSMRSYWRQYFRYARGDGKAGLFPLRHLARYLTYGLAAVVIVRRRRAETLAALLLGAGYVRAPVTRVWNRDRATRLPVASTVTVIPLVVALRAWGDIAKMAGYPVGLWWRVKRFGGLGWRTSWQRISPDGTVWSPARLSRESRPPTLSRADGSREARP